MNRESHPKTRTPSPVQSSPEHGDMAPVPEHPSGRDKEIAGPNLLFAIF